MIEYRTGDLFAQTDVQALAHGVNTHGVMGAGIAPLFRQRFPLMYEQYVLACATGQLQPGGVFPWWDVSNDQYVFNVASQDAPGRNARRLWLASGLTQALGMAEALGVSRVAVPRIGAGIGGIPWTDVKGIFEHAASSNPTVDLVVVSLPGADA